MLDSGGGQKITCRWGLDATWEEACLRGLMSGLSHMPPSTVPSDPDVGISLYAVDQSSSWLAAEAVQCCIKFSQWKIQKSYYNVACCQNSLTTCSHCCCCLPMAYALSQHSTSCQCDQLIYCVHEKTAPLSMFKKSSKLASFVQVQFNNMNIGLFSIKLPILVKICCTIIEILTFNKWS